MINPMNKYLNFANWQKIYPYFGFIIGSSIFIYYKISIKKEAFILSAEISAIFFGFALTFMGFLFSGSEAKYLKDMRQQKYRTRYDRLISFSRDAVYSCLSLMLWSLMSIIERVYSYTEKYFDFYPLEIVWAGLIGHSSLCMFRIFKITLWMLKDIE